MPLYLCGVAIADDDAVLLKTEDRAIANLDAAAEVDSKIAELNVELGKLNERRRALIDAPWGLSDLARQSRDILAGIYRNEMARLADYGFVVSAPRSRKERKPTALAA